jgi:anti-sigma factor RsiW
MTNQLSCKETVELVTDYLEKALLPEMEAQFRAHLAGCPDCTTHLAQMQQTIHMLRQLTREETPEAVKQELLEKFRAWQKGGD